MNEIPIATEPSSVAIISLVACILLSIIGYFIAKTLQEIDRSQTKLWEAMDTLRERLSRLEGEHNSMMSQGGHKKV